MALSLRCSSAPSRPNSSHPQTIFPPKCFTRPNKLEKSDFEGLLHSDVVHFLKHAFEVRKIFKSEKLSRLSFQMHEMLPSCLSLLSKPHGLCMNTWEETDVVDQNVTHYDDIPVKHIHATQRTVPSRHPAKAVFVLNALMLSVPFEAVAETCEQSSSPFSMPILLAVALVGATVGGLLARQRKGEMQRLNEQLRLINAALRRQAKIESYAPSLSYAPVGSRIAEEEVIIDPRKQDLLLRLKSGKNFLRNQDPEKAFVEFKTALELAQEVQDPLEEKKAARGLGASLQRQRKYKDAINYHSMVLSISERVGENSGNTEAYGAIADCYTELGDLEKAGKFYDKYIATLESD